MDCQGLPRFKRNEREGSIYGWMTGGAIQRLRKLEYSNRSIVRESNCSPTTVGNELCRGTPEQSSNRRG